MKFSIIIPTLNEEKYIGVLLDSLAKQTFKGFEVIVIDGKSKDKTEEKVMEYQKDLDIRFTVAPKRGVGFQRNYGLRFANHKDLIFFDADITVEKDFLEKINKYLTSKPADVLTAWFEPASDKKRDRFIFGITNVYYEVIKYISPRGGGAFIYVRKEPFLKVGGFSEDIILGEDWDLIKRLDKHGYKYKLVKKPIIKVSVRRLEKEGRLHFATNMLVAGLYIGLKGPIKNNKKIKYEYGKYD